MHRLNIIKVLLCLLVISVFSFLPSCVEDIPEEFMFTSTKKTMGRYIEDDPDLSEFTAILQRSKTLGLLKAYGLYTCFAPDNDAIERYYEAKGKSSIDDFTEEELKQIAYDHIVYGDTLTSGDFGIGRLNQMTMSRGFLSISYSENDIFVNGRSRLIEKDISVHNGMLHVISEMIDPSRYGIVDQLSKEERFTLFYEALILTGLADSLQKDVDESYNPNLYRHLVIYPPETNPAWRADEIPESRRYGYTILMESNETMEANGITDIESLKTYAASVYDDVYPEDAGITDVTDRRNSLNRFVAYHLIDKELSLKQFIDAYDNGNVVKTVDMYEYIETMCPNTLIEVTKVRSTNETNLLNYIPSAGRKIQIVNNFENEDANKAQNGIYHELDQMLVYDRVVLEEHSGKRLRFDMASFFPEFTNNGIRGRTHRIPCHHIWFPHDYIERIKATPQTVMGYVESNSRLGNYQGDELFMDVKPGNLYEFTITTFPVPAGTYEVRFGYLTNYARGVCQFYFDDIPTGVPINLNNDGYHEAIGWVRPGSDPSDPEGYENDKMMRNLGYMKAPACIKISDFAWGPNEFPRNASNVLRKILGIYTFDKAGHHTLSVKGLSGGQFMIDYLEFVPISALETEDIY
jgi:uncharacterized surface protein with fasciclin (FAS1) repeats